MAYGGVKRITIADKPEQIRSNDMISKGTCGDWIGA